MSRIAVLALGAALLAGCGVGESSDRANFIAECETNAEQVGGPSDLYTPICTCAADKAFEEFGSDALNLPQHISEGYLAECIAENDIAIPA